MKQRQALNQTATFTISVPQLAADKCPNINHALSLAFSGTVNAGATAVVSARCFGAPAAEAVDGGSLDAYALRGTTKTVQLAGVMLESLTVTISGLTTGTVSGYYCGFGNNDPGVDDAYVS